MSIHYCIYFFTSRHRLQYKKKVNPDLIVDLKPSLRQRRLAEERAKVSSCLFIYNQYFVDNNVYIISYLFTFLSEVYGQRGFLEKTR